MPISIRIICEKEKEISLHGSECSRLYAESHKNEYYLCMHVFRRDIIDKITSDFLMDAHTMKIHYSLFSTCNIAPNVSMQIFYFMDTENAMKP